VHVGRTLAISAAVVLAGAAPAGAAGWLPSFPLGGSGSSGADVAVGANGTALAAWMRGGTLAAARHVPGTPGFAAVGVPTGAGAPQAGVDDAGNATIAWLEGGTVHTAFMSVGATQFAPPQTFGTSASDLVLDVGPDGTAVVAWKEGGQRIDAALRDGTANDFGSSQQVSPVCLLSMSRPAAAVGAAGHAVVAWAADGTIDSAVRAPLANFPAADPLCPLAGGTDGDPAATIDGEGDATLAWTSGSAVTSSAGTLGNGSAPALATDAAGNVTATWLDGSTVGGATRAADASTFVATPDLGAGAAGPATLDVGPAGDALAVWPPASGDLRAARRAASGGFQPAADIPGAAASDLPVVTVDGEGSAVVAWPAADGAHAAVFDAGAPALGTVTAPATATVGVPADFAASATDRWSTVGLGWAFGDGATAAGGAVSHAFGAAGTPVVTVTASDAAGNAASAGRSVSVSAPVVQPPPPPPPPEPLVTPRVAVPVTPSWRVRGKVIRLLRLKLAGLPAGATAELRCKGKRCPLRRTKTFKAKDGRINLVKPLDPDQLRFRAGQRVELWVWAPNRIGLVVRWALKRGSKPQPQLLCVPLGATKARATC
jgi:hypothetical protein